MNLASKEDRERVQRQAQQVEALKARWRLTSGQEVEVPRSFALRTALEDGSLRAREGLLFGYEAIREGTRLQAWIDGPQADVRKVLALLPQEIYVGRSRRTEYGRVRILSRTESSDGGLELAAADPGRVLFLCVSRVVLRDPDTGHPTYQPLPELFGLDSPSGWRFDPEGSAIRVGRFAPFHGKRRRPDLEQYLIQAGSVIAFTGGSGADLDEVRNTIRCGVGEYTHVGMGEVVVHPRWVAEPMGSNGTSGTGGVLTTPRADKLVPEPVDRLFDWANNRSGRQRDAYDALEWVQERAKPFQKKYTIPTSQWGVLRRLAREAQRTGVSEKEFIERVHNFTSKGVSSLKKTWGQVRGRTTAAQALMAILKEAGQDVMRKAELLASEMTRLRKETARDRGGES